MQVKTKWKWSDQHDCVWAKRKLSQRLDCWKPFCACSLQIVRRKDMENGAACSWKGTNDFKHADSTNCRGQPFKISATCEYRSPVENRLSSRWWGGEKPGRNQILLGLSSPEICFKPGHVHRLRLAFSSVFSVEASRWFHLKWRSIKQFANFIPLVIMLCIKNAIKNRGQRSRLWITL